MKPASVIVEFYGIPRQRAGRASLTVAAITVADALVGVQSACPNLGRLVEQDGRLVSHYLLSLDGKGFMTDLQQPLQDGVRLLLLSADAGG